jgi:hypothetical protein
MTGLLSDGKGRLDVVRSTPWVVTAGVFIFFTAMAAHHIARNLPQSQGGDEWRYLYYAHNLLEGFYSPRDRVVLWNGPGYPMFLAPFVKSDWLVAARYANAVFFGGTAAYAWLILRNRLAPSWALAAVLAFWAYVPLTLHLPLLYTEVLCVFLVTAWIYHSLESRTKKVHQILAGFCLGLLCLTKVVFGAVLTLFVILLCVARLRRRSSVIGAYLKQSGVALVLCVPYLVYTYQLTGKPLYWSSASPNSFYWLSSPYPDEWGDWYHQGWVQQNPLLKAHHGAIFEETSGLARDPGLSDMEQMFNLGTPQAGEIFLKQAERNVREHPLKFARNWCGNVVRLFLDVPVSVRETPFWNDYCICNLPLLISTLVVGILAWRQRVKVPSMATAIGVFALLTLAIYSLSSGVARFLVPLAPIWWLGMCCCLGEASRLRRARFSGRGRDDPTEGDGTNVDAHEPDRPE